MFLSAEREHDVQDFDIHNKANKLLHGGKEKLKSTIIISHRTTSENSSKFGSELVFSLRIRTMSLLCIKYKNAIASSWSGLISTDVQAVGLANRKLLF